MVMSYFQATRPKLREYKSESFYNTGTQEKIGCFSVDGYCNHCKTVFEAMGCYFHFFPCQEARPSLIEYDIKPETKKKEMDELRKDNIREKGDTIEEMWECSWWDQFKNNVEVKNHFYLGDEKTHKAINNQFFRRLNVVAEDLFEVKLVNKFD